ncbi:MAG: uL22 family ribosomal protein, partial [Eubacteriales bacterium]|nr:uL22 family ribosomal protein [Eubacteriales bacterium]
MEARATAKYVRMSPIKLKPVADLVRNKDVNEALTILRFTSGKGAEIVEKVVTSA